MLEAAIKQESEVRSVQSDRELAQAEDVLEERMPEVAMFSVQPKPADQPEVASRPEEASPPEKV